MSVLLRALCVIILSAGFAAHAQKRGGTLTVPHVDTPPSPSIHEEGTASVVTPFMSLYNNLIIFDQHQPQNRVDTIVPELATAWKWSADDTKLTFTLRSDVRFHDGKPFTSADVKCTFDMVSGLTPGKIRRSPRQAWYGNLKEITVNGPTEVTFHLGRPQPSILPMLAAGWSPIYPCHVTSAQMRTKPIGTGPFRFVEYKMNEGLRLERNPDYWKQGLPYLDAIEFRIVPNRATRMLSLIAGKFDMSYPTDVTVPLLKDIKNQAPHLQCKLRRTNVTTNLIVNRDVAPFNNPDIRRALALTLDRRAFIDILSEGQAAISGAMLPPPDGVWGMSPEFQRTLLGYDPDVAKNREEARAIMRKLGYGPNNRLKTKVFTRDTPNFRDPALILTDHLKEIYVDAEVEIADTPLYYNRVFKKDYSVGLNLTGSSLDDPDQNFLENYACGSLRNYTNYCNPELEKLFAEQSAERDQAKRRAMVWEIEKQLAEDVARPIIANGVAAACWQPYVKNFSVMINSIYNGWRWEDLWLDK
jgi:peptide/nickel transport system substrate-binding protein